MTLDVRPFRDINNADIFNAIRNNATVDYQKRIPEATKASQEATIQALVNYRPQMNEFIDALVNRIGLVIFKNNSWTNPYSKFKRGMLEYGDTIEEIMSGLLTAKEYIPERDYLEKDIFGVEVPETQVSYHKVNRQNYYKLTVKEPLLRRAFISSNGLSTFVTNLMEMPTTSDNWDEFLLMTQLFNEYYNADGFFKINVGDIGAIGSDAADSKYFLRRVREVAGNLGFISRHYNAAGMPVSAQPEELELFITPEANAAIDVEALAAAFNIDRALVPSKTNIIPKEHFNIPGAQAVLTTKDFFVAADQRIDTTSAVNPVGLHTNYFLHHWQVISASRFVPAVLFTIESGTVINIPATPVTSVAALTIIDKDGATPTSLVRGQMYEVNTNAVTTPAGGANNAVRYTATGLNSPRSRITQSGAILIAVDETATTVLVKAFATDTANPQTEISASYSITGDIAVLWPNPTALSDADVDGLLEVIPEAVVKDNDTDVAVIPTVTGVQYKKDAVNVNNGSTHVITASTVFTAVARAGYELATGAVATWTLVP
jgi:hypothetical protein